MIRLNINTRMGGTTKINMISITNIAIQSGSVDTGLGSMQHHMSNGTSLARALLFTLVVLHRIPCDKRNCSSAGRKCVPRSCAEDQTALRQDESVFQDGIRQKINGGRAVPSASRTPPASDTAPHIPLYPIPSPCR